MANLAASAMVKVGNGKGRRSKQDQAGLVPQPSALPMHSRNGFRPDKMEALVGEQMEAPE